MPGSSLQRAASGIRRRRQLVGVTHHASRLTVNPAERIFTAAAECRLVNKLTHIQIPGSVFSGDNYKFAAHALQASSLNQQ